MLFCPAGRPLAQLAWDISIQPSTLCAASASQVIQFCADNAEELAVITGFTLSQAEAYCGQTEQQLFQMAELLIVTALSGTDRPMLFAPTQFLQHCAYEIVATGRTYLGGDASANLTIMKTTAVVPQITVSGAHEMWTQRRQPVEVFVSVTPSSCSTV
eukprot:SAG11_NODE_1133_length_5735_cov_8.895671_1_plen_157_part_10